MDNIIEIQIVYVMWSTRTLTRDRAASFWVGGGGLFSAPLFLFKFFCLIYFLFLQKRGGVGLLGSYLTNYLSVDRVSCQICRIVVASLKQNIFLYVKFILRELLQIYSIKFRFFNEYFCFCYLKNSSCTLNRRWWREGWKFFLDYGMRSEGAGWSNDR